jgi:hypothetical protein
VARPCDGAWQEGVIMAAGVKKLKAIACSYGENEGTVMADAVKAATGASGIVGGCRYLDNRTGRIICDSTGARYLGFALAPDEDIDPDTVQFVPIANDLEAERKELEDLLAQFDRDREVVQAYSRRLAARG